MAYFRQWSVFECIILLIGINLAASYCRGTRTLIPGVKQITVDQSGHGDFTTVQSAIDSVPKNNNQWNVIHIKPGTYKEQVQIPSDKPYIFLKGDDRISTLIVSDQPGLEEATFTVKATNIKATGVTFMNTYNNPTTRSPAPAATLLADRLAFYNCRFISQQDTLWDVSGRHYFWRCAILGLVDFICGAGQSIYEDCRIYSKGSGAITAQGRQGPNDSDGFVFIRGIVTGRGPTLLGRAWREYARVLFYQTNFSDIITPSGWDAWYAKGHEDDVTFAEYDCVGAGAKNSSRVSWMKKLDDATVKELTSYSFIDNEGWLKQQPLDDLVL